MDELADLIEERLKSEGIDVGNETEDEIRTRESIASQRAGYMVGVQIGLRLRGAS